MSDLYFPQLLSGAVAQFPLRKTRRNRCVKNVLGDGTALVYPDPSSARIIWELTYSGLSQADSRAIQAHFAACAGSLRAFTFIDPTDNMLGFSTDLSATPWQKDPGLQIRGGMPDPFGGTSAFSITNTGQLAQNLTQTLVVPSNYQFCLSAYVRSSNSTFVSLSRLGSTAFDAINTPVGMTWMRVVSSGRLNDTGTTLTVGLEIDPAQNVQVYGLQLDAQLAPSRYRPSTRGGVYPSAHWAIDQLSVVAEGRDLFSTAVVIETSI